MPGSSPSSIRRTIASDGRSTSMCRTSVNGATRCTRTGEHPGPGPVGDPRALWQVRLGTVLTSSPSVVDGMVYIGSLAPGTREGGALHAVDAQTGIETWRLATAPGDGICHRRRHRGRWQL